MAIALPSLGLEGYAIVDVLLQFIQMIAGSISLTDNSFTSGNPFARPVYRRVCQFIPQDITYIEPVP